MRRRRFVWSGGLILVVAIVLDFRASIELEPDRHRRIRIKPFYRVAGTWLI